MVGIDAGLSINVRVWVVYCEEVAEMGVFRFSPPWRLGRCYTLFIEASGCFYRAIGGSLFRIESAKVYPGYSVDVF